MTVKELVEELEGYDQETNVRIALGYRNNLLEVADIEWTQPFKGAFGHEVFLHIIGRKGK